MGLGKDSQVAWRREPGFFISAKEGKVMKTLKIEKDVLDMVIAEISKSELFSPLSKKSLLQLANIMVLNQYNPDECIVKMNDPSDGCFMIIKGEAVILQHVQPDDEIVEIARRKPYDTIGEIGFLLNQPRGATVQAVKETLMLKFDNAIFEQMFKIPGFGQSLSRSLASRLRELSISSFLPPYDKDSELPSLEVIRMLPMDFIIRQNILPLHVEGTFLHIGFVHDPKVNDLRALRRFFPSMQLKLMHIDKELFDKVLQSQVGTEEWSVPAEKPQKPRKVVEGKPLRLNRLLKRMVAEGASDLHLSAARVPRWRIDGEIRTIQDAKELEAEEVLDILNPVMDERDKGEFKENNDTEFAYSLPDVARFRINLFRDHKGVGAVIRVIPSTILSIEQLGLPTVLKKLCEKPKGLVLVTGPTGAGKSTTLAAMIDHINKTRRVHVITIEDPIEFVHQEELALINQRQVGHHTNDYTSALRAALREDPDILLIGELRDRETIALALEAANTGSLVFGTLQTATAISTISRIIDFFPPDQQDHVRSSLTDSLQGVVSQTLCKRIGGGRVVASEVLIVDAAVRHLIHEEKTNQIVSTMQTKKAQGNKLLNEELAELIKGRRVGKVRYKVEYEEALSKTPDREDLARRLGKPLPKD
jgi:twitching motility protein PilT